MKIQGLIVQDTSVSDDMKLYLDVLRMWAGQGRANDEAMYEVNWDPCFLIPLNSIKEGVCEVSYDMLMPKTKLPTTNDITWRANEEHPKLLTIWLKEDIVVLLGVVGYKSQSDNL